MGTERYEVHRGPCQCGCGQFVIKHCTPDHPYATGSGWYETSISCESCRARFELVEQNGNIVLVEKSDVRAKDGLVSEWHRRGNNLMARSEVQKLLKQLEALLDGQPSMAACHRLLKANNFLHETIGTFRKKWKGAEHWINRNIHPGDLNKVMALLSQSDPEISKEVIEIDAIWKDSQKPLPIVGKPILKTS